MVALLAGLFSLLLAGCDATKSATGTVAQAVGGAPASPDAVGCQPYRGPNPSVDGWTQIFSDITEAVKATDRNYGYPIPPDGELPTEIAPDFMNSQIAPELPHIPAGAIQRHSEYTCRSLPHDQAALDNGYRLVGDLNGVTTDLRSKLKDEPQYKSVDWDALERSLLQIDAKYSVRTTFGFITTCHAVRSMGNGQTVAHVMSSGGTPASGDSLKYYVESAKILCPDVAG